MPSCITDIDRQIYVDRKENTMKVKTAHKKTVPQQEQEHASNVRVRITSNMAASLRIMCRCLERDGDYKYRGPTFGNFVTFRTEGPMQDSMVARLQSTRVRYRLPSPPF